LIHFYKRMWVLLLATLVANPFQVCLGFSASGQNKIFNIIVEDLERDLLEPIRNATGTYNVAENSQSDDDDPPPHEATARMARYITHKSNWTAMATISVREPTVGYPFANVFSISDGPSHESSGVPYMYLTPLEISVHDLNKNNKASLTMSLAQGNYCQKMHFDEEDPRCAHVILTGEVVTLDKDSEEAKFASKALFTRHPEMPSWPDDHGFYFAKLQISNILVLDFFGGAKTVKVADYFAAKPQ